MVATTPRTDEQIAELRRAYYDRFGEGIPYMHYQSRLSECWELAEEALRTGVPMVAPEIPLDMDS